jgi:acyl-CoA synthetase (AMP-forming)/AMP-acid ligase II
MRNTEMARPSWPAESQTSCFLRDLITSLEQSASAKGDHCAVRFFSGETCTDVSYRDLHAGARHYAALFQAAGLEPGCVIFIVLKHHRELYDAFLGAMMAGFIPSFLPYATPKQNPESYWAAHAALFRRVTPGMIVTFAGNEAPVHAALGPDSATRVLSVEAARGMAPPAPVPVPRSAETVALLQHSSGTTGQKKGVMLTHGQIERQIASYAASLGFTGDDIVASWLPLYHDMGLFSSFLMPIMLGALDAEFRLLAYPPLCGGGAAAAPGPEHAARRHQLLRAGARRYAGAVSQLFRRSGPLARRAAGLLCHGRNRVRDLAIRCPVRTLRIDPVALTEPGQPVRRLSEGGAEHVSNGRPIAGIRVRIETAAGRVEVCPGARSEAAGEIQVSGDFVFDGYYRNPEGTAQAFTEDGWYRTGDIGFCDEGEIFVCGRTKELLIIHGKNYYVGDIEQVLSAIGGVKPGRAVVFDIFDPETDSDECVVMAETELDDPASLRSLKREIRERVAQRLTLQVRSIELVAPGTLVKTTSGKMSRSENRKVWMLAREGR